MADDDDRPDDADKSAAYWLSQLTLAAKEEEDWRTKTAPKVVDRYRDDKDEDATGSRLNIFTANVELLKPNIYSQRPSPDVQRREIYEGSDLKTLGSEVASLIENALEFSLDSTRFDQTMESVRDDMLIPGRGVSREVYEVNIVRRTDIEVYQAPAEPAPTIELMLPDGSTAVTQIGAAPPPPPPEYLLDGVPIVPLFDKDRQPYIDQKADEWVETRFVFWADFRLEPARQWEDVGWIAFRHPMTRDMLEEEFGKGLGDKIPLTIGGREGGMNPDSDMRGPADPPNRHGRAEIWEIWDKRKRKRVWVAMGHDKVLRTDDDPLKLADFFPCPCPLYSITTTNTMVPRPEFCLYQDQADELDCIQSRIRALIEVLKAVSYTSGEFVDFTKIARASDGDIIPVEQAGVGAPDLAGNIWTWPIQNIVMVIQQLGIRARELKQEIYEITGIHDLLRGSTKERETAKAQILKGQYGQVRMTPRALPMARYVRDTMRIKAEIICEQFDQSTLERIGGRAVSDEMIGLMREEKLRNTVIAVATDATVRPDVHAEQEQAVAFMSASSTFLQQIAMVGQAQPAMVPLMLETFKQATATFKWARNVESLIDQTVEVITAQVQAVMQQQQAQAAMAQQAQAAQAAQMAAGMPPPNGAGGQPGMMQ